MRLTEGGNRAGSIISLGCAKMPFYRPTRHRKSGQEVFDLLPAFCCNPYGSYPISVGCWYCFMSSYLCPYPFSSFLEYASSALAGEKSKTLCRSEKSDEHSAFIGCGGGIWTTRPSGYECGFPLLVTFCDLPKNLVKSRDFRISLLLPFCDFQRFSAKISSK